MLARYAALVKNLRGVVYFDPSEDVEGCLRWLARRFRYRTVGVPPTLMRSSFEKKPFRQLFYPDESVEELRGLISETLPVSGEVCEALLLASCFASPVLVLGENAAEEMRAVAVDSVISRMKMQARDWKLHLRIADYTVLDLYEWSTENALLLWIGEAGEEFKKERKKRIEKDKKRYWRLERGDEVPWQFMLYFDVALLLAEHLGGEELSRRLASIDRNACSALAIGCAVLLSEARIE